MFTAEPVAVPSASPGEKVLICETAISAISVMTDNATSFCSPLNFEPGIETSSERTAGGIGMESWSHRRMLGCGSCRRLREDVAAPGHRLDHPRLVPLNFSAQARDVSVECARRSIHFLPPNRPPELLSCQDFFSVPGHVPQQPEFLRAQPCRLIPHEDAVAISINDQVSQPELSHN